MLELLREQDYNNHVIRKGRKKRQRKTATSGSEQGDDLLWHCSFLTHVIFSMK